MTSPANPRQFDPTAPGDVKHHVFLAPFLAPFLGSRRQIYIFSKPQYASLGFLKLQAAWGNGLIYVTDGLRKEVLGGLCS